MTTLHIKNMVCDRCIQTVERLITAEGLHIQKISLGEVRVAEELHELNTNRLDWKLMDAGFELIYDKNLQLVAKVKAFLIGHLKKIEEGEHNLKLSVYLSEALKMNYQQISRTFSEYTGDTIEKYFMNLKIERVKELITYDELTLSEIAWKLGYSSVQHLSMQFRKVMGYTVREFREIEEIQRNTLDSL